jgi:hypothetical protein
VEELLLALAHAQCQQSAEARKHLETALAWMRQGVAPVRAAALTGLVPSGPLAALAPLAITPPAPRLQLLQAQTAYELNAVRAEVEQELAKLKP